MSHLAEEEFPVSYADILQAREHLKGRVVTTPLLRSPILDEITGGTVLLKPENLQRTGSFKFRGAFNALYQIPEEDRAKGVVACSSGNHAQGVAESARLLGIPATIVMPVDAPAVKLERTRASGAKVVTYRRGLDDRDALACQIQAETGAKLVHPYDNAAVIAGQGTVGLEVVEQAAELGLRLDLVMACTGGGGLSSGIALALAQQLPHCEFRTVEPEAFDDYRRSLLSGKRERNASATGSVCDALMSAEPGRLSFPILKSLASGGLAVSDHEAVSAVSFAFRELKLVLEPGGAVALAAALSCKTDLRGRIVCVVLTGGNVDFSALREMISPDV